MNRRRPTIQKRSGCGGTITALLCWASNSIGPLQKVIGLNPDYADGNINLALAQYSTLIGKQRELPDGRQELGYVYYLQARYQAAKAEF